MRYFPQNITKVYKDGAKPEDMTPPVLSLIRRISVLSLIWRLSVFEMGFFIYVLWANKCQEKIFKILPLPSQESSVFTVSCWFRDGEKSVGLVT